MGIFSEAGYDAAVEEVCHLIDDEMFDNQKDPNVTKVLQKLRGKVTRLLNASREIPVRQRKLPGIH